MYRAYKRKHNTANNIECKGEGWREKLKANGKGSDGNKIRKTILKKHITYLSLYQMAISRFIYFPKQLRCVVASIHFFFYFYTSFAFASIFNGVFASSHSYQSLDNIIGPSKCEFSYYVRKQKKTANNLRCQQKED